MPYRVSYLQNLINIHLTDALHPLINLLQVSSHPSPAELRKDRKEQVWNEGRKRRDKRKAASPIPQSFVSPPSLITHAAFPALGRQGQHTKVTLGKYLLRGVEGGCGAWRGVEGVGRRGETRWGVARGCPTGEVTSTSSILVAVLRYRSQLVEQLFNQPDSQLVGQSASKSVGLTVIHLDRQSLCHSVSQWVS